MSIKQIAIISVPVTDQEVSKAFYTEALGFTVALEAVDGEQRWIELAPPGSTTTITLVTWFPQMPPGSIQGLVFETDNIEQAYEKLKAHGAETEPIENTQWGKFVRFKDPDGNGLGLRQRGTAA